MDRQAKRANFRALLGFDNDSTAANNAWSMQYRHILVTGGCGFIGSHYIELLLNQFPENRVTCWDAMTYAAHPDTASHLESLAPDRYAFDRVDITGDLTAKMAEVQPDAVVNFAAETHVDRSILDPGAFVRTNIVGVQNLLSAVRQLQTKGKSVRYVQVSTDEVYGTLTPTAAAFTEASFLEPNSPYAASKAAADLLILAAGRTYGQDVVITRCSNNYGPRQFPEKLIPLVIANAIEGKSVPVYGDGKQVRDWIYVTDHCRGIQAVLERGQAGEVYNISSSEERHNIDLVRTLLGMLGKSESLIQHVGDRPAHDRRYALNAGRLRKELGWAPQLSFEQGMKSTVDWYLAHETWWKRARNQDYFKYYQKNYAEKFSGQGSGAQVN